MPASFRVNSHLEITNHGAFVIGDIESGVIRIGDTVVLDDSTKLAIIAVEFADSVATRTSQVCLRFKGIDTKSELVKVVPAGTLLEVASTD
jgi:hypothetical protein